MKKLTAVVVGFGQRGERYCDYALEKPNELEIVAVADASCFHDCTQQLQKKRNNN